jgi:hypothetical protein
VIVPGCVVKYASTLASRNTAISVKASLQIGRGRNRFTFGIHNFYSNKTKIFSQRRQRRKALCVTIFSVASASRKFFFAEKHQIGDGSPPNRSGGVFPRPPAALRAALFSRKRTMPIPSLDIVLVGIEHPRSIGYRPNAPALPAHQVSSGGEAAGAS